MARRVFFSFHYKPDNWRASEVRKMGALEANPPVTDNKWETITGGGDEAIQEWIDDQMSGKSCAVVLIGTNTAGRKWITYEIEKAWNDNKGVVGIYVHNLKDSDQHQTSKGKNPFDYLTMKRDSAKLSSIAKAYDPPYSSSTNVYGYVKDNIADWVEEAITIRNDY